MTCGIYKLTFNGTTKCYIGQSLDIERRFINHCSSMRNDKGSRKLCAAYRKFGMPVLIILKECKVDELNTLEDLYIKQYNSAKDGFNYKCTHHGYRSTLHGEDAPMSTCSNADVQEVFEYLKDNPELTLENIADIVEISPNIVKDISAGISHRWLKEIYGEDIYNKVIYNKNKRKGELSKTSIYSNAQIEEVFLYMVNNPSKPLAQLTELFNIGQDTIKAISQGRNHKWLESKYPNEYNTMLSLKGKRDSHSAAAQGKVYPNIISPDGIIYSVTNIKAFAREHGLNDTHLGRTLRGLEKQHKGWKILQSQNE